MKIFKNYSFWTALAGAVVIFLNALGDLFGFSIDNDVVTAVITGFAGVLVVLGVVSMGETKQDTKDVENDKQKNDDTKSVEIDSPDKKDEN